MARAAIQGVISVAAPEGVVAGVADQFVGERVGNDQVVAAAANDIFDVGVNVGVRATRRPVIGDVIEAEFQVRGIGRIIGSVIAGVAIQLVSASAADECVVAAIAVKGVITGTAIERFACGTSVDSVVARAAFKQRRFADARDKVAIVNDVIARCAIDDQALDLAGVNALVTPLTVIRMSDLLVLTPKKMTSLPAVPVAVSVPLLASLATGLPLSVLLVP